MKRFKFFSTKRLIAAFLTVMLCASSALAESTVYFFVGSIGNATCQLSLNGKESFELRGPLKKTFEPDGVLRFPYHSYHSAKKKCVFKEEGKMLFSVDYRFTNASTGAVTPMSAEIQLNLTDGSVYYVELTNKGLKDIQFKILTEKEGLKRLAKDKYKPLPDYIEE